MSAPVEERDAVVVGAGFAGLYMLHKLRNDLGLDAEAIESGGGVGGTWYWNTYPGARCDTESYIYCYSFSQDLLDTWVWEDKYPSHDQLRRYLEHVTDSLDLRRSISFNTTVVGAVFDETQKRWQVDLDDGRRIRARFLITGVGLLASAAHYPDVEGLADFTGRIEHTGRWSADESDLVGKRVGVIGTGSSGVQLIPQLAKICAEVVVFQRTPQFTVPAVHDDFGVEDFLRIRDDYASVWHQVHRSPGGFPWRHNGLSAHEVDDDERERIFEQLWSEGGFRFLYGSFRDLLTDRQANEYVSAFVRKKIRERVDDPRVAEILLPRDHPFGGKRPIVDTGYFEAFNRDNVHLVDLLAAPIRRVTETGIEVGDDHIDLDVIVFATGFDAITGPLLRIDPQGVGGRRLAQEWADGPSSFMGLCVSGFPNLFTITGPGSTFGNMPVVIQHHAEWIAECIATARTGGHDVVEVEPAPQRQWMKRISEASEGLISALADSWFTGANIPGKHRGVYVFLGSYGRYREELDQLAASGYPGLVFDGRPLPEPAPGPAPASTLAR